MIDGCGLEMVQKAGVKPGIDREFVMQKSSSLLIGVGVMVLLAVVRPTGAGDYVFSVRGAGTYLNGKAFLVKGLRCSNALRSEKATRELIDHLPLFASYGVNKKRNGRTLENRTWNETPLPTLQRELAYVRTGPT